MIRAAASAAVLALCVLLAGCPESVHPASDPARAAPDPELFGVWHGTFDDAEVYLHVGPAGHGMTATTMVEHGKDGALKTEHYVAFPTKLERLDLLNVRPLDPEKERGYSVMKYRVAGKRLTLWFTSYGAIREDLKGEKLRGIAEDGPSGTTRITAPTAELAAYLQTADQKRLFDKPLEFRRGAAP